MFLWNYTPLQSYPRIKGEGVCVQVCWDLCSYTVGIPVWPVTWALDMQLFSFFAPFLLYLMEAFYSYSHN